MIISRFQSVPSAEILSLDRNRFVSTIPSEIGQISSLRDLHLSRNYLTGSVPKSLTSLDMRVLRLQFNDLTGQLLEYIDSWPNLQVLNIEGAKITGTIPETIGKLTNLERLLLGPYLNGTIPDGLLEMTNLKDIRLMGLGFGGTFPSQIGRLSKLGKIVFWLHTFSMNWLYNFLTRPLLPRRKSPLSRCDDSRQDSDDDRSFDGFERAGYDERSADWDFTDGVGWLVSPRTYLTRKNQLVLYTEILCTV